MSSFNVGAETVGSKTWEELYRENLAKNGIPYEKAPLKNGVIQVKDVGILGRLAAIGKTVGVTPVKIIAGAGGAAVDLTKTTFNTVKDAVDALGDVAKGAAKTAGAIPTILIVLAVGIAGYLIFAGKKGTDLTKFIPIPRR